MAGSTSYPQSVDNKTALQDGVDIIQADDVNDAYVPIDAIETFVGPSGAGQSHNIDILQYLHEFQHPGTRLRISWISGSTLRAAVGAVMCNKSDDSIRKLRRNTVTVDIDFTMLDTGAEQANKKYYVIAVADASNTSVTFKLSLSNTAPSGVTTFWVVAEIWNNESSNFEEESLINYDDQTFPEGHLEGGIIKNHATVKKITIEETWARDDSNAYNMHSPELSKDLSSVFSEGNNGGFLDTGTAAAGLYHIFQIYGPTKHADYICSTGASPSMPSGYTVKRYLGSRYYDGTDWLDFFTTGKGRLKKTFLWQPQSLGTSTSNGSWTTLSCSTYCRDGYAKIANIAANAGSSGQAGCTIFVRCKGSSAPADSKTLFSTDHDDQQGPGNPAPGATGETALDASGDFEYQTSGASSFNCALRGFTEEL